MLQIKNNWLSHSLLVTLLVFSVLLFLIQLMLLFQVNQTKGSTAVQVAKSLGFMECGMVALALPRPPPPEMPASLKAKLESQ
ncbi:hypothetical protein EVAR_69239_1 [Eumeta japonica]|uniref:Uncharacterized protein n=1 Tax=Eumeta variegata TaxID=151549 RepID=A0A4C2AB13_EUMVA|nr:hypothetical protein EVAR_69239_1 [Eumeta japonica]